MTWLLDAVENLLKEKENGVNTIEKGSKTIYIDFMLDEAWCI
jgi:hypothetical protein